MTSSISVIIINYLKLVECFLCRQNIKHLYFRSLSQVQRQEEDGGNVDGGSVDLKPRRLIQSSFRLLSTHADRHVVDISFTVFLFVCVSAGYFVRDISGVGWRRAMKFCRVVDLGVQQVISPFGELWPRG